ncbi:MAG: hypothetical protein JXX14_14465 [Deltaproteobacteria bacterium]|nr:hypothetical protein [Deltaproteobacteria bacterium]
MSDSTPETVQTGTVVFKSAFHRLRRGNGHTITTTAPPIPTPRVPVRKPARVALMLAFAHSLEEAINNGEYTDRADAARKLGLTRARISQLLDLLMLAPDIQEKILFMERVDGIEPTSERALRKVVAVESWGEQREMFIKP